VSIFVGTSRYPGHYGLSIYNSAGEHILTLDDTKLISPYQASYSWNGTNKYNEKCAPGVYVFYLIEPFNRKLARVLLVR